MRSQKPIAVRYGSPTATTRKMFVYALTNDQVTVSCNGVSYVSGVDFTLNQVGADRGTNGPDGLQYAGYIGEVDITGLETGESYSYSVTQNTDIITGNIAPFFTAASDFSFFIVNCDAQDQFDDSRGDCYSTLVDYAQNGALPCVGYFHADDLGYVDRSQIDDTGYTGKQQIADASYSLEINQAWSSGQLPAYDYIVGYFAHMGMLGNTANDAINFGLQEDRAWCRENLAFFPQWGNHEFGSNSQCYVPTSWPPPTTTTAMHATNPLTGGGWDGVGVTAWDAVFGGLVDAYRIGSADTTARHFAVSIGGGIKIVVADWISRLKQDASAKLGTDQIDDILDAFSSAEPFKILMLPVQLRDIQNGDSLGSAGQLESTQPAEFARLLTSSAVSSIMQSSTTNGLSGVTAIIHGDWHHAYAASHRETGGDNDELVYSISPGTVNGSSGHTNVTTAEDIGKTFSAGSDVTATTPGVGTVLEYFEAAANDPHCVRVDVYNTLAKPEMHITLIDYNGTEVWSSKFIARSSNEAFSQSWSEPSVGLSGGFE